MTLDNVSWIADRAVRLRTINPIDEDFADLEAFGELVGDARVVQLGEQCHGDGATFHAKTRMVAYLHQRLGFDVLVWESGLYDCHVAWEAFCRGEDPVAAARLGIFGTWTKSVQCRPIFDYLARHAGSDRPLELAGMDCQFSGEAPRLFLVDELTKRVGANAARLVQMQLEGETPTPEVYDVGSAELTAAAAVETDPFWRQCLVSIGAEARGRQVQRDEGVAAMSQNRDLQMGDNLVWLAQHGYPGRKIVVWVDTGHMTKDWSSMSLPGVEVPAEASMASYVTQGNVTHRALGDDVLCVHFTAAEGRAGGSETTLGTVPLHTIAAPSPDSFEDLFLRAGLDNAIVDLRPRGAQDSWVRDRRVAKLGGYAEREAIWPEVVDMIAFTRVMYPSDIAPD